MPSDPTRAEALRSLLSRAEAGEAIIEYNALRDVFGDWPDATSVFHGSLDAVARLEAPLRERGWEGPTIWPASPRYPEWQATWQRGKGATMVTEVARCPDEARARLLAVLKAMLHEETADAG